MPSESYSVLLEGSSSGSHGSLCLPYNPVPQALDPVNVVASHGRGDFADVIKAVEMGTLA